MTRHPAVHGRRHGRRITRVLPPITGLLTAGLMVWESGGGPRVGSFSDADVTDGSAGRPAIRSFAWTDDAPAS